MQIFYDFIFFIFAVLYLPYLFLKKKFHSDIWQRLGLYSEEMRLDSDIKESVWIHAVSVGEVATIKTVWESLRNKFPSSRIIVSTVTRTGNELAKRFANKAEKVFYLPLDFSFVVNSVLKKFNPGILIIAETEIWPNLIYSCHKKGIPVALINGRISDRAFKRYRLVNFFLKGIFKKINVFCVRSGEDGAKFIALGAPLEKMQVVGNLKFCSAKIKEDKRDPDKIRNAFSIKNDETVLAAASTHKGEEEIVLEVFNLLRKDYPALRLIIAPRHVERAADIRRLRGAGSVVVIDKIGILDDLYAISDIVFVGGSLIKHGGHNIIEPAVYEKPILFGPYMFNFKDVAREFLKNNAAIMVKDKADLEINCRRLLSDKEERSVLGKRARQVVLDNQGALEKTITEIKKVFN